MGHCYNTININAPIDKVWDTISNFHDLSWAAGVITSLRIVGAQHSFSYSIDDGPGPIAKDAVDNYIGSVQLSQTHNGTFVEWRSSFESTNSKEVAEFCDPIYQALLSALQETFS